MLDALSWLPIYADRGEQHAFLLEANIQLVNDAIRAVNSLLATGMDWDQVKVLIV